MSANPRSPESGEIDNVVQRVHLVLMGSLPEAYPDAPAFGSQSRTALFNADIRRILSELSTARERADRAEQPHPLVEWNPSHGTVLWWAFHDGMPYEPPYVGTPLDSDWPGYHSHWTRIHAPTLSTPTPTPDHA